MNEIGRVSKPSVNAPPRYTSRNPARCTSHIGAGGIVGIWAGKGGKPNIFIVPAVKKTRPATILRMLNIRSVHGDRDRSNIDMCLPIQFRLVVKRRQRIHHFAFGNGASRKGRTIDSSQSVLVMSVRCVVPGSTASCERGRPTI